MFFMSSSAGLKRARIIQEGWKLSNIVPEGTNVLAKLLKKNNALNCQYMYKLEKDAIQGRSSKVITVHIAMHEWRLRNNGISLHNKQSRTVKSGFAYVDKTRKLSGTKVKGFTAWRDLGCIRQRHCISFRNSILVRLVDVSAGNVTGAVACCGKGNSRDGYKAYKKYLFHDS